MSLCPWTAEDRATQALHEFLVPYLVSNAAALVLLPIAAGQLAIAVLLLLPRAWRVLGVAGALAFLAGIAPLGVGSAFPFSVIFGAALVVLHRRLASRDVPDAPPVQGLLTAEPRAAQ